MRKKAETAGKHYKHPYETAVAAFTEEQAELFNLMLDQNDKAKREGSPHIPNETTAKNAFSRVVSCLGTSRGAVVYMAETLKSPDYEKSIKAVDPQNSRINEILTLSILTCDQRSGRELWNAVRAIDHYCYFDSNFCYVAQFAPTNLLSRIVNADVENEVTTTDDTARIDVRTKSNTYSYLQDWRNGLVIPRVSTVRLMDYMYSELARNGWDPNISFTIDQYLIDRGKEVTRGSRNKCRIQIREDLEILMKIALQYHETESYVDEQGKRRRRLRLVEDLHLYGGHMKTDRGPIEWSWNPYLVDRIREKKKGSVALFHKDIFKIDATSDAYLMARYIELNYRMNAGKKDEYYVIPIATLLKEASELPPIEKFEADPKAGYHRLLITPFFRNLDQISYLFYEVHTKDGALVKDYSNLSLEEFKTGQIVVNYDNYPINKDAIEKFLKKTAERTRRREAKKDA